MRATLKCEAWKGRAVRFGASSGKTRRLVRTSRHAVSWNAGRRVECLLALKNFIPELRRAFLGKFQMSEGAKKSAKELTTHRNVERLQRFNENFEEVRGNRCTLRKIRARAGRVVYVRSPLPVPAGVGESRLNPI